MTRDEWKYSRSACRRLSAMGLPMGLQCTITAVGSVIMQWAVNGLGSSVVAAITAAGKTQNLLACALESIGTAMATYAGQNLGAARLDRVRSGVKSSYIMVVAYSVLAFIALHFGDVVIIGLFLDTKTEVEIVAMARDYMFWNSLFFIPLGALIVWRYTIQGLGYSTLAMMAGVAEMVARTVIGLVLIPVLGFFGAELANPAAWVAACLFLYPAYLWTVKHLENRLLAGHLAMQHSAGMGLQPPLKFLSRSMLLPCMPCGMRGTFCTIPAFFQKALALRRQKQYNNCIFIHRGSERIE